MTHLEKLANIKTIAPGSIFCCNLPKCAENYFSGKTQVIYGQQTFQSLKHLGRVKSIQGMAKQKKKKGQSAFENSTRATLRLFCSKKTRNIPVKYRLAALPAALRGKTKGRCRKMNHRLMTGEKRHTHILTKQITGVALLGDGPQLVGAPGIALVIIPRKLHHLRREKKKSNA